MSTRGAIGFRLNGNDYVTYNHSDSYPSWLGKHMLAELAKMTIDEMKAAVANLQLVDESVPASDEQVEALHKYARTHTEGGIQIGSGDAHDWYNLLRDAQGTLLPYVKDKLPFMIDSAGFLYSSLFCEFAYLVNLDEGVLEFYTGFNKDHNAAGRYANVPEKFREERDEYAGVVLRDTIPLDSIQGMSEEKVDGLIQKWDAFE